MSFFQGFINAFGGMPEWCYLICPLLLLCAVFALAFFKRRTWYGYTAALLGAIGFFFVCCGQEIYAAFAWLALYFAECVALLPVFKIPFRKLKNKREKRKKKDDMLYEKFHQDISVPNLSGEKPTLPPKVCCFEPSPEEEAAESDGNIRLSYAVTLLEKLRASKLSASDRLETDSLARTLEVYREKPLTATEIRSLNDCLASVLKLTAKYHL